MQWPVTAFKLYTCMHIHVHVNRGASLRNSFLHTHECQPLFGFSQTFIYTRISVVKKVKKILGELKKYIKAQN